MCMVIDFGQTSDGLLFLVMELLRGRTLAAVLKSEQRLPLERTLKIAVQLCDALDAAHRGAIVHRDLKPGNIMLVEADHVKVLDFGLAKSLGADEKSESSVVTSSGQILGTPRYMPPEAVHGETDARSDLYSFGVILYEMLAGRPAFKAGTMSEVLAMHALTTPDPLPSDIPGPLAKIVTKLLEKDPADRYQSAAEVRAALAAHLDGTAQRTAAKPSRWPWLAVGAVLVAGSAATAVVLTRKPVPAPAPVPTLTSIPVPSSQPAPAPTPAPAPAPAPPAPIELTLTSSPDGATITVDGKPIGKTPMTSTPTPNAVLDVTFSLDGYDPVQRRITADRSQSIDVTLSRHKPHAPSGPKYPF
jgi:serine/threonine-protein kinase